MEGNPTSDLSQGSEMARSHPRYLFSRPRACNACRRRKIKCNAAMPACMYCKKLGLECSYTPFSDGKFQRQSLEKSQSERNDNEQAHHRKVSTRETRSTRLDRQRVSDSADVIVTNSVETRSHLSIDTPSTNSFKTNREPTQPSSSSKFGFGNIRGEKLEIIDEIIECSSAHYTHSEDNITARQSRQAYIGPVSGMGVLSPRNLRWMNNATGDPGASDAVHTFLEALVRLIKDGRLIEPLQRQELPSPEMARKYVNEYFIGLDVVMPVLADRDHWISIFETCAADPSSMDVNTYALYNTVVAIGSRIYLSEGTKESFERSQQTGWRYFQNALLEFTQLFCGNYSVRTIQALLLMVLFVEGTACPQLEYTLCTAAARLVQAQGWQRNVIAGLDIDPATLNEQRRVFWLAYYLDKNVSLRNGRPSVIDDDDVNCPLPAPLERPEDYLAVGSHIDWIRIYARQGRLYEKIFKELYSVSASYRAPDEIMTSVTRLKEELNAWRDSIPEFLRPGEPIKRSRLPQYITGHYSVVLHILYWQLFCMIHRMSIHCASWLRAVKDAAQFFELSEREESSNSLVIEAARSVVMLTEHIEITSYTPSWLILGLPITSFVVLFINLLRNPKSPTAVSDLALIDVIVGFLARYEYLSPGTISFPSLGKWPRLAKMAIDRLPAEDQPLFSPVTEETENFDFIDALSFTQLFSYLTDPTSASNGSD